MILTNVNKNFLTFNEYIQKYYNKKHLDVIAANFIYKRKNLNNYKFNTKHHLLMSELYESFLNSLWLYSNCYNGYYDAIEEHKLNEGLITTYSYETFALYFEKYTGITDIIEINFVPSNSVTKIMYIIIYYKDYELHKVLLLKYVDKCGYFISDIDSDDNYTMIKFEPLHIVEVTSTVDKSFDIIYDKDNKLIKEEDKCNGILYHITPAIYYNKILNNGLIPHSGNKKSMHPSRLYFFPLSIIENEMFFRLLADLLFKNKGLIIDSLLKYVGDKGLEICVLKIDLYKYPNLKYRFFLDPNHPKGIFTYEPIHPVCVELYDSFYIK